MLDLLVRGARASGGANGVRRDIGIRSGRIVEVAPNEPAARTADAAGALVTPALVEPHIHLDAVLTVGQPRYNVPAQHTVRWDGADETVDFLRPIPVLSNQAL